MYCPECRKGRMKVARSIPIEEYPRPYVIRQRKCSACGYSATTTEKICSDVKPPQGDN